jgi:hypothetical protein
LESERLESDRDWRERLESDRDWREGEREIGEGEKSKTEVKTKQKSETEVKTRQKNETEERDRRTRKEEREKKNEKRRTRQKNEKNDKCSTSNSANSLAFSPFFTLTDSLLVSTDATLNVLNCSSNRFFSISCSLLNVDSSTTVFKTTSTTECPERNAPKERKCQTKQMLKE